MPQPLVLSHSYLFGVGRVELELWKIGNFNISAVFRFFVQIFVNVQPLHHCRRDIPKWF